MSILEHQSKNFIEKQIKLVTLKCFEEGEAGEDFQSRSMIYYIKENIKSRRIKKQISNITSKSFWIAYKPINLKTTYRMGKNIIKTSRFKYPKKKRQTKNK